MAGHRGRHGLRWRHPGIARPDGPPRGGDGRGGTLAVPRRPTRSPLTNLGICHRTTYGAMPEVEAAVTAVRAAHVPVHGVSERHKPYSAGQPALAAWVHNMLTDSFLVAFQSYGPRPLTRDEADRFVGEQARIGALLGAEPRPETADALSAWISEHRDLAPTRAQAQAIAFLRDPPLPIAVKLGYRPRQRKCTALGARLLAVVAPRPRPHRSTGATGPLPPTPPRVRFGPGVHMSDHSAASTQSRPRTATPRTAHPESTRCCDGRRRRTTHRRGPPALTFGPQLRCSWARTGGSRPGSSMPGQAAAISTQLAGPCSGTTLVLTAMFSARRDNPQSDGQGRTGGH